MPLSWDAERPLPHAQRHAGGAGARAQGALAARALLGRGEARAARGASEDRLLRQLIDAGKEDDVLDLISSM